MLYFFCPDNPLPCGGVKMIYHWVDVLNSAGLTAQVAHRREGFRCGWFPNGTPVTAAGAIRWTDSDIAVLPEVVGPEPHGWPEGVKKVILNQSAYLTFRGYTLDPSDLRTPYRDPDLLGVLTVSADSRRYLAYAFPEAPLFRIRPSIDPAVFYPAPGKLDQIAYMPRKFSEDIRQVLNLLKFRGVLQEYRLAAMEGIPPDEVARVLRQSKVFLHFAAQEGFGLPAAEAMACGCPVVGFHGQGGREFLRRPFAWPTPAGDAVSLCAAVEKVLDGWRRAPAAMERQGQAAAAFIAGRYSPERERAELLKAWREILRRHESTRKEEIG